MSIVKLLGVPTSAGCRPQTSSVIDQHNAPGAIRSYLKSMTAHFDRAVCYEDIGNLDLGDGVGDLLSETSSAVQKLVESGDVPMLLGGSHTLTLGALRGLAAARPDFSVIYIDAHADLMPHADINYGSALFYALKEEVVKPQRLALIGLREVEAPEYGVIYEQSIMHVHATDFEEMTVRQLLKQIQDRLEAPYYISIDLDALDPAFAPGVTCPYPGGLTTREVLYLVQKLCETDVIGLDIVEHAPINDRDEMTSKLAADMILRFSQAISARKGRH